MKNNIRNMDGNNDAQAEEILTNAGDNNPVRNENETNIREYIIQSIIVLKHCIIDGTIPREGKSEDLLMPLFFDFGKESQPTFIQVSCHDNKKRTISIIAAKADSKFQAKRILFSGTVVEIAEYLKNDSLADIWYAERSDIYRRCNSADFNKLYIKNLKKFERSI